MIATLHVQERIHLRFGKGTVLIVPFATVTSEALAAEGGSACSVQNPAYSLARY
jgi:hypothetical protein